MKKHIFYRNCLLMVLLLSSMSGFAQKTDLKEYYGAQARQIIPQASYVQERDHTPYPAFVQLEETARIDESSFSTWLKTVVNADKSTNFTVERRETDDLGFQHIRYLQTFKGIPVDKALYIVHAKNGYVKSFNGIALEVKDDPVSTPLLTESEALSFALKHMGAEKYMWEDEFWENELKQRKGNEATHYPKGQLVWFELNDQTFTLAYKFDIFAASPNSSQRYYIDAGTGKVLNIIPLEHDCVGASVNTIFNGNRSINTEMYTGTEFRLRDDCQAATVRVRDWNSATLTANPVEIDNTTNTWTTMNERFGGTVLWEIKQSYNYFLNVHSRASTDNANGIVEAYINAVFTCSTCPGGITTNNASMGGDGMTMKVGLSSAGTLANSYATVDIIGHEYTHAVTGFSSGLVYQDESGALNESFSDIFGEVIERYVLGSNDWLLGSERTNGAIRDMTAPNNFSQPDTYQGSFWCDYTNGGLNCTMNDNGGVHTNSGVQNYWYYLLVAGGSGTNDNGDVFSVSAIGNTAARAIAYRNLTVYMGPNSTFADARTGAINAAIDLYGSCSDEVKQVTNAWHAVGVGGRAFDATAVVSSDYNGRDVSCYDACDGSATASLEGALLPIYDWSTGATSQSVGSLCPGTYTVTVTNLLGLGCTVTKSVTITNTPQLTAPSLTLSDYNGYNIACNGNSDGIAIANPAGGTSPYSYNWSNGQSTKSVSGLSAGTYTVTITDANGCEITRSATLTEPPVLNNSASPTTNYNGYNISCFGGNDGAAQASPSGGVMPYTFEWSDGQTTNPATQLYATTYTVTVTDDNGCTREASTTLTEPPQLTIDAGENKIVYFGYPDSACATLEATGDGGGVPPYTLSWSTGSNASSIEVCPMVTTVYYLTITDANGCMLTDSVQVCVFDVRCGIHLDKVVICHPTGSATNPSQTLCVSLSSAMNHIANHPGEQLAACGTIKVCEFSEGIRYVDYGNNVIGNEEGYLNIHPNPFTGTTQVNFMLPESSNASIGVYDMAGREQLLLINDHFDGGLIYEVTLDGSTLTDGIYLLIMQSDSGILQTRKIILSE